MAPKNRPFKRNLTGLDKAVKQSNKTADKLLRRNRECLIPCLAGEEHDKMNNCHIISEGYLNLIADRKGQILGWPTSARSINRLAVNAIKSGQFMDFPNYPPVSMSKNHKDCKYTFACHYHDNKVFKSIDNVTTFDVYDIESHLNLGLRAIVAYSAWYQGHKLYAQDDFNKDTEIRQNLKKYPQGQPLVEKVREFAESSTDTERWLEPVITSTTSNWQSVYANSELSSVISSVTTAYPALRFAGAGICNRNGHHIAVTILPKSQGGCIIVATAISRHKFLRGIIQWDCRSAVRREADAIKRLLEKEPPAQWLAQLLSQHWAFLYLSPDDYNNDDIITREGRQLVEQTAADKFRHHWALGMQTIGAKTC